MDKQHAVPSSTGGAVVALPETQAGDALNHPQPMTIELIQPQFVITFTGQSG